MGNIRIKDIATTAASTASDDFIAIDGATNGTRKLDIYNPTIGGALTLGGSSITFTGGGDRAIYTNSTQNLILGVQGVPCLKIIGATGAVDTLSFPLTVGGNLTVSGTGNNIVNASGGNFLLGTTNNASNAKLNVAGPNNAALRIDQGGLNYYAASQHIFTNPAFATEYARFTTSSSLLIGTTTDSSNGRLQLATHTTSAGGIGFGTDVSIYRNFASQISTNAGALTGGVGIGYFSIIASGTSPLIFNNGDGEAFRVTSGRGVNIGGTGAVSAGNLNVAGDATFGGVVKAPAGSSTSPSHTFSGDTSSGIYSLGTKKLGIAVNANIAVAVQADVDGSTGSTVYVKDLATAPTVNPSGGGYLFSQGGALKWRGSSGTVTTIANA